MARPDLDLDELRSKIPQINTENAAYAAGDHWQGGTGYTGPLPAEGDARLQAIQSGIERIFVSRDVLKEIRLRERWALTGKAWTWNLQDAENKPLGESEAAEYRGHLEKWMEEKQVVTTVADAIESSSWAGDQGIPGRGLLRFYIPGNRMEGGRVEAEDLGDALSKIELESPDSATGTVILDGDTEYEPVGFMSWTEQIGGEDVERSELVYTDEQGITKIEVLEGEGEQSAELNLGGRITMYELRRPLLIDSSLRSQQKFLNHCATAFQAAISGAAWVEEFFIGLMPPGEYTEDGDFIPEPLSRGPGRSHFLQPAIYTDEDGIDRPVSGTGAHVRGQTVSPTLFTEGIKAVRAEMISSAFQEYTLLTGLAQASGEKLQLAKGDFEASASDTANETALMVRWVLETAVALGEAIMGQGEPTGVQAYVEVHIDTGVVTAEQKLILSQLRTDKFISHETALAEAGYDQPNAEIAKIRKAEEEAGVVDEEGNVVAGNVDATAGTNGTSMDTEIDELPDRTTRGLTNA